MSSKHNEPRADGAEKLGETSRKDDARPDEAISAAASSELAASGAKTAGSSAAGAPEEGDDSRVAALAAELAALREELAVVNDKYLRKLADDINFRKRMAREKEDGQRFAVAALLGDMVPILDDFDRAIASAEVAREYAVLHNGVTLIRRQLGQMLENKYGLVRFPALGQVFDPNRHEAVAMTQGRPGEAVPEGVCAGEPIVAEEFLPGYTLHERILRTAKVRVRMPPPAERAADGPVAGDAGTGDGSGEDPSSAAGDRA